MNNLWIPILLIILAPLIGGLVYGLERIIKARMQRRIGPPVLQPFYD
ncbi:MAG: NADH-quinone oxidoreductase subunit H, partial [Chitinophagaceae bacterium]|nr:NADH-quinone oxidoreductase subunit H [Chitinophagaceae bacterium]